MTFTEETVFPVFTFNQDTEDCYVYFSKFVLLIIYASKREIHLEANFKGIELNIEGSQIEISKESFIKEHKFFLQRTGLTDLFVSNSIKLEKEIKWKHYWKEASIEKSSIIEDRQLAILNLVKENEVLKEKIKYLEDVQTKNDFEIDSLKNQMKMNSF